MNFLLSLALLLAIISLIKDLLKGFNNNKFDVYFDIIFIISTMIPWGFNLVYFLRRDCDHFKIFMINLHKFIRLDSFDEFYREKCEKGEWFFCNNEFDWERKIDKDYFYFLDLSCGPGGYFYKSINPFWGNTIYTITEENFVVVKNIFKIKFDISKIYLDHDKLSVTSGSDQLFEVILNDLSTEIFDLLMEISIPYSSLSAIYLNLEIKTTYNGFLIKHIGGRSRGQVIIEKDNYIKISLMHLLSELKGDALLDYFPEYKSNINGYKRIYHYLTIQEILAKLKSKKMGIHIFKERYKVSHISTFIAGKEIVNYINDGNLNMSEKCQFFDVIKSAVQDCDLKINIYNKFKEAFGEKLGDFLIYYTREHFGFYNNRALNFLLEKTSCWCYRYIGSNWQAKRYLRDINYIFEKSGVPLLTHSDNNINPTRKIINMSEKIPKCTKVITRKVLRYDRMELINLVKNDNMKSSLKKHLTNDLVKHSLGTKELGPIKRPKELTKFLKNSYVDVTNNPSREISNYDYEFKFKPYRDALLSKIKCINLVQIEKCQDFIVKNIKQNLKSEFLEHKDFSKNLIKIVKENNGGFIKVTKGSKPFKVKCDESDLIKLDNYYKYLEDYEDEIKNDESYMKENGKEVIVDIACKLYNDKLGVGRNVFNMNRFLNGGCNPHVVENLKKKIRLPKIECYHLTKDHLNMELMKRLKKHNVHITKTIKILRHRLNKKKLNKKERKRPAYEYFPPEKLNLKKRKSTCEHDGDNFPSPVPKKVKKGKMTNSGEMSEFSALVCIKRIKVLNDSYILKQHVDNFKRLEEERKRQEDELSMIKRKAFLKKAPFMFPDLKNLFKGEVNERNSIYWAVRRNSEGVFLRPYSDYTEEEFEAERNLKAVITPSDSIVFPCIYAKKYHLNEYTRVPQSLVVCLKKYLSQIESEKILYHVKFIE